MAAAASVPRQPYHLREDAGTTEGTGYVVTTSEVCARLCRIGATSVQRMAILGGRARRRRWQFP